MRKHMRGIQRRHKETTVIFRKLSTLRKKKDLCDDDFALLLDLREALLKLAQADRFVWIDGKPEFDLYDELLTLEKEMKN